MRARTDCLARGRALSIVLALALIACDRPSDGEDAAVDASSLDASTLDGSILDAAALDAPAPDAPVPDGSVGDAGAMPACDGLDLRGALECRGVWSTQRAALDCPCHAGRTDHGDEPQCRVDIAISPAERTCLEEGVIALGGAAIAAWTMRSTCIGLAARDYVACASSLGCGDLDAWWACERAHRAALDACPAASGGVGGCLEPLPAFSEPGDPCLPTPAPGCNGTVAGSVLAPDQLGGRCTLDPEGRPQGSCASPTLRCLWNREGVTDGVCVLPCPVGDVGEAATNCPSGFRCSRALSWLEFQGSYCTQDCSGGTECGVGLCDGTYCQP